MIAAGIILFFIYIISIIAVAIWDHEVKGTEVMSWVEKKDIFTPVHNTFIAIRLWSTHNPFKT